MEQRRAQRARTRAAQWLRRWLRPGLVLSVLALALLYALIGCPIRFFTGLSCPGCGMTRALWALAHLRFAEAWHWHPLVFLLPLVPVALLVRRGPLARPAVRRGLLVAACALMLGVWLVRLFGASTVVTIGRPPVLHLLENLLPLGRTSS